MVTYSTDISDHYEAKEFNDRFWNWWDNFLTKNERDKFNYYHSDMAKIFFFNKVYRYNLGAEPEA